MDEGSDIWRVTQPIGAAEERSCGHVRLARAFPADRSGCPTCRASGGRWVNLLACLVCGAVGCCDSSPGQHAHGHFEATGHPLARTLTYGQDWGWCYVDEVFLERVRVPPEDDARGAGAAPGRQADGRGRPVPPTLPQPD